MDKLNIPEFATKEGLFEFLVEHKAELIAEKKFGSKFADAVCCSIPDTTTKAETISADVGKLAVKVVINTTNLMDSHNDVHIDGLWKKTLRENKGFYLLQEHEMKFDKIISDVDQVKARTEKLTFKQLGIPALKGETEALIFDAEIDKSRNEFMFNQYAKGFVKNHSVGMRYVKIALAVNSDSPDFAEEKKVWNKYIDSIANKKTVEEKGFFWAVTEAKILEGSAVVKGSNFATPTQSVESKEESDPSNDSQEKSAAGKTTASRKRILITKL